MKFPVTFFVIIINFGGQRRTQAQASLVDAMLRNLRETERFLEPIDWEAGIWNTTFTVTLNAYNVFTHFDTAGTPKDGLDIEIFNHLQEQLAFRYKLVSAADGEWGRMLPNGSFTGLIGQVQRKEADMALSGITRTTDRARAVRFSNPYFISSVGIITHVPYSSTTYSTPIPFYQIPLLTAAASLVLGGIGFLVYRTELNILPASDEKKRPRSYVEIILLYTSTMFSVSSNYLPRETAARIALGSWFYGTFLVAAIFGGFLTASSIPTTGTTIDTLYQLVEAVDTDQVQMVAWEGTFLHSLITESEEESFRGIAKKMVTHPSETWPKYLDIMVPDNDLEFPQGIATLGGDVELWFTQQKTQPNTKAYRLRTSKNKVLTMMFCIALRKDFPDAAVNRINRMLFRMKTTGLISKWASKYGGTEPKVATSERMTAPPLNLKNFSVNFYALLAGYALSLLVFVGEIVLSSAMHK